ncbi:MAG: dihydrofolate reductase family protein [Thermomicrobiales bacterium]
MTNSDATQAPQQPSGSGSTMRKIILTEWITLDGFTAGPDNDMSFVGESFNDEMAEYEGTIVDRADTLILGRVTYESFAGSWPYVPDKPEASEGEKAYARKLNAMRKIVFSKTLEKAEWNHSTLMKEINKDEIEKRKQENGKDLLIYGSASIVQQMTNLGLIDEYQLLIHPVVLGSGKALFKDVKDKLKLHLVDTKTFNSGVMLLTYRLAREEEGK